MSRSIVPAKVKSLLAEHQEIALIDVREHGEYGERHPFHSVNIPFSRFEVDLPALVPNHNVLLILFDESEEGRAQAAAVSAERLGYHDVRILSGGAQGWEQAGYTLFAGVNVPSKTFGEMVEHHFHTPSITAQTLFEWQAEGRPMTLLDGRTEQEYHQRAIPQAKSCPNGELPLRAEAMVNAPDAPVIVHCAGRTRSLVGAETLRQLSPHLEVYALENGTQGWELAGFEVACGLSEYYPGQVKVNPEQEQTAQRWANKMGVQKLTIDAVQSWLQDDQFTNYVFDVRTEPEVKTQPFAGAVHAPGGQLLQATDLWVGVRFSRILLISNDGCRAPVVGGWLSMMGFHVAWYNGTHAEWQQLAPLSRLSRPEYVSAELMELKPSEVAERQPLLFDVRSSGDYQKGHYVGSCWLNRSRLMMHSDQLPESQPVVIVAESAVLASLVVEPLQAAGYEVLGWLKWLQDQQWLEVMNSGNVPPHEARIDYLYFVHDRHMGNLEAAKQYLAWELGLLDQLDSEERSTYKL